MQSFVICYYKFKFVFSVSKEDELKFSTNVMEISQLRAENSQLMSENSSLRNTVLALNSEVYGAKLAAKYLDKELAGRIQQLQLLGREMRGEIRDKLWRQLESEILLQRHKTVVRACRRNSSYGNADKGCPKPDITLNENGQDIGEIRTVLVKRKSGQGLGISITVSDFCSQNSIIARPLLAFQRLIFNIDFDVSRKSCSILKLMQFVLAAR